MSNIIHVIPEQVEPKITFVGSPKTGKTLLIEQLINSRWGRRPYLPTASVGFFHYDLMSKTGHKQRVQLWDTVGMKDQTFFHPIGVIQSKIIIIMYSLQDENSLTDIDRHLGIIKGMLQRQIQERGIEPTFIMCGLEYHDPALLQNGQDPTELNEISFGQGYDYAKNRQFEHFQIQESDWSGLDQVCFFIPLLKFDISNCNIFLYS